MNKNMGILERWWAVRWAETKSVVYSMFHLDTRVFIKTTWLEDRRASRYANNYLVDEVDNYREVVQFIGVIRGYEFDKTFEVVRTYYGGLE